MSENGKAVYYHSITGDPLLLADEINKWCFLEAVSSIQNGRDWSIYAFCIVDHGAYFVSEAEYIIDIQKALEEVTSSVWSKLQRAYQLNSQGSVPVKLRCVRLNSQKEIILKCRELHRIPMELGIVQKIGDYWWSSYNSYMGIYQWQQVNCIPVNTYFSEDQDEARRMLRRCHTQRYDSCV